MIAGRQPRTNLATVTKTTAIYDQYTAPPQPGHSHLDTFQAMRWFVSVLRSWPSSTTEGLNQIVHHRDSGGNGNADEQDDHPDEPQQGISRQQPLPCRCPGGEQNDNRPIRNDSKQHDPPKKRNAQF